MLCPEINLSKNIQSIQGIEIRRWLSDFNDVIPAPLVIEAFACKLPDAYIHAMAAQARKPVWLNLEYLSAEAWVEGCHGLASPQANLPLVKYFFFPGFTHNTGGLLLERDLLARRDAFLADKSAQAQYWLSLDVPPHQQGELRISLFSYENSQLQSLLTTLSSSKQLCTCLVPVGRVLPQLADFFKNQNLTVGNVAQKGNLRVHILPFVPQEEYDKLLWACDLNLVRGEDSCVRAQWAGKPFIWQVYPQHDGVHHVKMRALLDLYCTELDAASALPLRQLWTFWNRDVHTESNELLVQDSHPALNINQIWTDIVSHQPMLLEHAQNWSQQLSTHNLALNLLDFSHKVGRIHPFEI
jgi:uncharacterized repeat protein (TIGR03837 family)